MKISARVTPSVYVSTYQTYTNGRLTGEWVELEDFDDKEEFLEYCAKLFPNEDGPEFMYQDYEGVPDYYISESYLSEEYFEYQANVSGMDAGRAEAYATFISLYNEDSLDKFESSYQGVFNSDTDFGYHMAEMNGIMEKANETLEMYFDFERYGRDLLLNEYSKDNGHVFLDF